MGPRAAFGTKAHLKRSKRIQKEKNKFIESEIKTGALRAKSARDPSADQAKLVADWFKGNTSRQEAEEMLYGNKSGTFVVRMSESRLAYTLSTVHAGQFRHYPIESLLHSKEQVPGYRLMGSKERFNELTDLIAHYKKTCMSTKYPKEKLVRPLGEFLPDHLNPDKEIQYASLRFEGFEDPVNPEHDFTAAMVSAMTPGSANPEIKVSLDSDTIMTMKDRFGKRQPSKYVNGRKRVGGRRMTASIDEESDLEPTEAVIGVGHDYNQLNVVDQLLNDVVPQAPDVWGISDADSLPDPVANPEGDYAAFNKSMFENSRRSNPAHDYAVGPGVKKDKAPRGSSGGLDVSKSERKARNTVFREAEAKILAAAKENAKRVKQLKKKEKERKKNKKKKTKSQPVPMVRSLGTCYHFIPWICRMRSCLSPLLLRLIRQ